MTATSNPTMSAGNFSGPEDGGEYAFARRLRHRMVLSYLTQSCLHPTFNSMVQQTDADAHLCGNHLQRLVLQGQWVEALDYLGRFNSRRTVAANALHFFLHTLSALANVAAGARNGSIKSGAHTHGMALSIVICRSPKLCSLVKAMLASPAQCAALDSKPARLKAVLHCASLGSRGSALGSPHATTHRRPIAPPAPPHPHHQSSSKVARETTVRRAPCTRTCHRKALSQQEEKSAAFFKPPNTSALMDESLDRVASLIGECIEAGKPLKQLQSVGRGAPASSQIISGSLTNQAKNSGISSAQNSGKHLTEYLLLSATNPRDMEPDAEEGTMAE